jgi:hypothetical protein
MSDVTDTLYRTPLVVPSSGVLLKFHLKSSEEPADNEDVALLDVSPVSKAKPLGNEGVTVIDPHVPELHVTFTQ